jgi:hypothetical protein
VVLTVRRGEQMKKKMLTVGIVGLVVLWVGGMMPVEAQITYGTGSYQQTSNNPCVIGDPSCNQGGFIYTSNAGTPTWPLDSPIYQVVSGPGTPVSPPNGIPQAFILGIDHNYANTPEVLEYFQSWVSPTGLPNTFVLNAANSYTGPTTLPTGDNGNGFSDAILTGFNLPLNSYVFFRASNSNASDGMEEFFIIPGGTPSRVPEPGVLLLLGLGLVGVGVVRRKIKK